jgi:hypothetical protein
MLRTLVDHSNPVVASIAGYDFARIRTRIIAEGSLPEDEVDAAIEEFRKFLTLIALIPGGLGMISKKVDEVWHTFILYTAEYARFCSDIYGRFIHHQPNDGTEEAHGNDGVQRFLDGYRQLFGDLHPIWCVNGQPLVLQGSCTSGCDATCGAVECKGD